MNHEVGVLLESVIEPGWYNSGAGGKGNAREGQHDGNGGNAQDPKKSRLEDGSESLQETNNATQLSTSLGYSFQLGKYSSH
jgi:hypothetical protein